MAEKTLIQKIKSLTWYDITTKLIDILTQLNINISEKISEAPIDGNEYVRKNASWVESSIGGGTIPNLPQVLTKGDLVPTYFGVDHNLQSDDIGKVLIAEANNVNYTFDDTQNFKMGSSLFFQNVAIFASININLTASDGNTIVFGNHEYLSGETIELKNEFRYRLYKLSGDDFTNGIWSLTLESSYYTNNYVAGTNISIDYTDPLAPMISATGGASAVTSVNTQTGDVILNSDNIGDGTTYKQYSATEKTKLAGIASGATANSSDATLLARANHTGTQLASTISDFNTQVATTAVLKSNNLSDLASASTARTNLGLGTLATQSGTFSAKQDNITLTTTGASGSASLVSSTLNIPTYTLAGLGGLSTSTASTTYAPISTTPIILLNDNITTSAVTGTTTNTILASYLIPANTFATGDRILIDFVGLKSTTTATGSFYINVNTTNSLSGATKIAGFTGGGAGNRFYVCQRSIAFKSSTSFETLSLSVNNPSDLGVDNNAPATITYDTTQAYYLIISVTPSNSADSFNQSRIAVTKYKSKTTF